MNSISYHLLYHTTISLTVHLPLILILISNSPRILISRQTIDIEIDSSIAYRYAALHLLPSICSPVTMSFITSVHYVIMAFVPLLLCLYILCPLWLPHHSVYHFGFFYVNYFYHLTILSIII